MSADATVMEQPTEPRRPTLSLPAQIYGVLAPPLAWGAQLGLLYLFVYVFAGGYGIGEWALHIVSIVAIVLTLIALALSIRGLQLAWPLDQEHDGTVLGRQVFMAGSGVLLSGLFLMLIIFTGATPFIFDLA